MKNLNTAGRVPPYQSYPIVVGTRFGEWTVVEVDILKREGDRMRPASRVRCSCGRECVLANRTLQRGISKRCKKCAWADTYKKKQEYQSIANPMIPVGNTFGRWTVVETGLRLGKIRAVRVVCVCGTEKIMGYFPLRQGSKSCGCAGRERSIESVWNSLYKNLFNRGKDVHLTLPQVQVIARMPCAYCGIEPSNVHRARYVDRGTMKYSFDPSMNIRYSGIDRIDSNIGYVVGNVVPCCRECNFAKRTLSVDAFLALINRIHAHNPTVEGIHHLAATLFSGT